MSSIWLSENRLREIVGDHVAERLMAHGGGLYYCPRPTKLMQAIGGPLLALAEAHGGENIEWPRCDDRPRAKQAIVALLEQGVSASEAARRVGCTRSWACLVRRELNNQNRGKSPKGV